MLTGVFTFGRAIGGPAGPLLPDTGKELGSLVGIVLAFWAPGFESGVEISALPVADSVTVGTRPYRSPSAPAFKVWAMTLLSQDRCEEQRDRRQESPCERAGSSRCSVHVFPAMLQSLASACRYHRHLQKGRLSDLKRRRQREVSACTWPGQVTYSSSAGLSALASSDWSFGALRN